jgi:hypothetical protein
VAYRTAVASGSLGPGYATEDGVALHYVGTELAETVSAIDGSTAWHVVPDGSGGCHETDLEPRRLPVP